MRFAICNETFQEWPHEKACQFARELGYTGWEIASFTFDKDARRITPRQRREIRAQAEGAGLTVVGLHWLLAFTEGYYLTSPEGEVRRRTADYLKELVRLCRDLGGSLMVLGSPKQRNLLPGVTHDQAVDYAADVLQQIAPVLEEQQVTLCVEPLGPAEGDFLNRTSQAIPLIEKVASPWCKLHLDVKAMSSEGTPIPEIIKAHTKYFHHFHANDANRLGPGMGEIDFVPILRTLKEVGYDGWVSVEVFDYSPGPERLARESIQNLKRDWEAANK